MNFKISNFLALDGKIKLVLPKVPNILWVFFLNPHDVFKGNNVIGLKASPLKHVLASYATCLTQQRRGLPFVVFYPFRRNTRLLKASRQTLHSLERFFVCVAARTIEVATPLNAAVSYCCRANESRSPVASPWAVIQSFPSVFALAALYMGEEEKAFALGAAGCRRQREILTRHAKGDAHSDVILHHHHPFNRR